MTKRLRHLNRSNHGGDRGSALIALIAAILIFSVLAAALLPMVSSSSEQAVLSSLSDRAYLLAEAGFRYVKSRYDNAPGQAAKNTALEDLDNDGNFTLSNNEGGFRLGIFSYFFPIPDSARGTPTFTANPPGRLPIDSVQDDDNVTIQSTFWLSIDGRPYQITSTSGTPASADDNVTFTVNDNLDFSSGANAYPAALTTQTSLVNGGNLAYNSGHGAMFPLRNGRITLPAYPNPLTYRYNDRQIGQFLDVRDPANPNLNVSWTGSTFIVLNQFTRVRSIGVVDGGALVSRRQIDYYIAGGAGTGEGVAVALGDFQPTDTATTTTSLAYDALAITQSTNNASLLQASSDVTNAPLERAHRRSDGLLSYDAQVKLGFYTGSTQLPESPIGIIPYAATPVAVGLTFRLNTVLSDTSYYGYGLSFMRANNTSLPSNVFFNIVPAGLNDQPLMVLWQQTGDGTRWLAYKNLQPYIYPQPPAGFDDVITAWIPTNGLWGIDNTGGRNASPAWHYVDNSFSATTLQSPLISLNNPAPSSPMCDGAPIITLSFWGREIIELSQSRYRAARISYNGGAFAPFTPIAGIVENGWRLYTYDLSSRNGQTVRIQFTVSPSPDDPVQWDIDDVKILYQHCRWPVQNSTLLVRLKEATVVQFNNGRPQPIFQGDRVYGVESGTQGMVMQPPLVESGDWSAGNPASGTLLLDNVVGSGFDADGEDLYVVGRTGGLGAHAVAFDNDTQRKVNIIKTFYANQSGSGTPSSDPLDPGTRAYPRRGASDPFHWPPEEDDNWTSAEDYFRLVRWDAINDANVADMTDIPYTDSGRLVENSILRSHHPDLQSPPLGQPIPVELGLHGYGAGADNVYFDDFGLWLYFGTSSLFDTVLQQ